MASIASDMIRGNTDTILLRFLCEKDSYGYEINKQILELTEGAYGLNEATLYTAFKRLEKNGFITSYWGDENSGARRRYYTVTEAGRAAYAENCREWQNARTLLERLIEHEADQGISG
ncbi:MAG: helix-turn-helix transcriptional regulator [Solobacterium sp.]|jgi:DNA-binding PadR family transcriptional regulator|nr:helix-turn-helix transcriptional regulator [Solobacterium sp.]